MFYPRGLHRLRFSQNVRDTFTFFLNCQTRCLILFFSPLLKYMILLFHHYHLLPQFVGKLLADIVISKVFANSPEFSVCLSTFSVEIYLSKCCLAKVADILQVVKFLFMDLSKMRCFKSQHQQNTIFIIFRHDRDLFFCQCSRYNILLRIKNLSIMIFVVLLVNHK